MSDTRKWRVVDGKHHTKEKTYKKGEIVESDEDLATEYPGKFEEHVEARQGKKDKKKPTDSATGTTPHPGGPPRNRDEPEEPENQPTLDQMDEVFDKGSTKKARPDADEQEEAETGKKPKRRVTIDEGESEAEESKEAEDSSGDDEGETSETEEESESEGEAEEEGGKKRKSRRKK